MHLQFVETCIARGKYTKQRRVGKLWRLVGTVRVGLPIRRTSENTSEGIEKGDC